MSGADGACDGDKGEQDARAPRAHECVALDAIHGTDEGEQDARGSRKRP